MNKLFSLLAAAAILSSCGNTWDSDARNLFHQGCMESARDSNMDETAAKSMCDCRLEKVMEKYPNFAEAMDHVGEMMDDPDLKECK